MGLNAWIFMAAAAGSAFDASGYLQGKASSEAALSASLKGRAIYRIEGLRYLRFDSGQGAVLLPATSDSEPKLVPELALCLYHLPLLDEALLVRDGLPVDDTARSLEPRLRELIAMCRDGRIRGPTRTELTPDGAVLQIDRKKD
jgi:hypothetical protein